MDRKVTSQPKRFYQKKSHLIAFGVVLASIGLLTQAMSMDAGKSLTLDKSRLVISEVKQGEFQAFVPLRGTVLPKREIFLDAVDGGRVEQVFVEEGNMVQAGEKLLRLSNSTLQLSVLAREADVAEQINNLRNSRLAMERSRLDKINAVIDSEYTITKLNRQLNKSRKLVKQGVLATDELEAITEQLEFEKRRLATVKESQQTELSLQEQQIIQLEQNVETLKDNLVIARKSLDNLTVTAPISGQLTFLQAELGQSIADGQRLGQVDDLNQFKITTQVDEFYLSQVNAGMTGEFMNAGQSYQLKIAKVYPGVNNGQFKVDWDFAQSKPVDLRRGQTIQLKLELSSAQQTLVVEQGGFYQDTGGAWAFVMSDDGLSASRRSVEFGRRNADVLEVVSGLKAGDLIVSSSYGELAEMQTLEFKQSSM